MLCPPLYTRFNLLNWNGYCHKQNNYILYNLRSILFLRTEKELLFSEIIWKKKKYGQPETY